MPERVTAKVLIGGLMRCCTGTLSEYVHDHPYEVPEEGATLPCQHCSSRMVVRDGAWQWDREYSLSSHEGGQHAD